MSDPAAPVTGRVVVSVPASSANLGPGFDCVGLALDIRDTVAVHAVPAADPRHPTVRVQVTGAGSDSVPKDARHLVAASLRSGLADLAPSAPPVDLQLHCTNEIPHGQGLGSSAAAIVAGLLSAWALARGCEREVAIAGTPGRDRSDWLVDRSSTAEGHGDNAAASVLGGAVAAWHDGARYRAADLALDPGLQLVTCVPEATLATEIARALLPLQVPHSDAAFTGARTILLTEALRGRRELLLVGTEDRLHQQQRAGAMPHSHELLLRLRAEGVAACVSGAGPALLCLGADVEKVTDLAGHGWTVRVHEVGSPARIESNGPD